MLQETSHAALAPPPPAASQVLGTVLLVYFPLDEALPHTGVWPFFMGISLLAFVFVWLYVPETMGKSLEEVYLVFSEEAVRAASSPSLSVAHRHGSPPAPLSHDRQARAPAAPVRRRAHGRAKRRAAPRRMAQSRSALDGTATAACRASLRQDQGGAF